MKNNKDTMPKNLLHIFALILIISSINQVSAQVKDYDLKKWPAGKGPDEIGIRLTQEFLDSPHKRSSGNRPGVDYSAPPLVINYPEVCTWLGGIWFANVSRNVELLNSLEKRLSVLLEKENQLVPPPTTVSNSIFGAVPLEIYLKTKNKKYFELGMTYAEKQWNLPENAEANQKKWADEGYSWQTRLWIDDIYVMEVLQIPAYLASGDRKYADRMAREMVLYLEKLQLENGLFYHSPDAHHSWGRGNGWMAAAMADLLRILPKNDANRVKIMTCYHRMMDALLKNQAEDGMWRQIVDDPGLWKETSCTAMFTYAIITGVKEGWLDKKIYGAVARKAWLALTDHINKNDQLTDVCAGTSASSDREYYNDRPKVVGDWHGHAPVLWCATALLR